MGSIQSKEFSTGEPFKTSIYDYKCGYSDAIGTFLTNNKDLGDVKYVKVVYNKLGSSSRVSKEDDDYGLIDDNEMPIKTAKEETGNIDNDCEKSEKVRNLAKLFDVPQTKENKSPNFIITIKNKDEIDVTCEPCSMARRKWRLYHVVIIIQASNGLFWSIEKNNRSIVVQMSRNSKEILKNLGGTRREEELKYDGYIEKYYKKHYKMATGTIMPSMHEVLTFVTSIETQLGYHPLSQIFNCQGFLMRLIMYVHVKDVRRNCSILNDLHWRVNFKTFLDLLVKFYPAIFAKPTQIYRELKESAAAIESDIELQELRNT